MMPASGPVTIESIDRFAGIITGSVNLPATYTNDFAIAAKQDAGLPRGRLGRPR